MNASLYRGLALGAAVLLVLSGFLWLRFGERIYFDRMISAIAGCF
ncbi:hypothetical protein [Roseibium sp.]